METWLEFLASVSDPTKKNRMDNQNEVSRFFLRNVQILVDKHIEKKVGRTKNTGAFW